MVNALIRRLWATGRIVAFHAVLLSLVAGAYESALAQDAGMAQDAGAEAVSSSKSDIVLNEPNNAGKKPAVAGGDSNVFENAKAGIRIQRAEGWLVGVPSHGAVAVFRAAGESEAQIEFRVSDNVVDESRESFFSAFQNSLLRVGFVEIESREKTNYSGRIGPEYEYRVLSDGREFRLITWLFARETEVWIVTGFFPLSKRDAYYRGFQKMLRTLEYTN